MNNVQISFLTTFLAGLSTLIGIIPTYFSKKYQDKIIPFSLSFSAGVMLTISFISLIPETINYLNNNIIINILLTLIFINIGIIISTFIDKKLTNNTNNSLLNVGIVGIIALILHNIPEGITTFLTMSNNYKIGLTISLAIALHNIPEGISIAVPIYYSTYSRKKTFLYTFISGFSELFGAIIANIFFKRIINNYIMSIILGITAGIMIHLSIFELLPMAIKYKYNKLTIIAVILGIIIMFTCIKIFCI